MHVLITGGFDPVHSGHLNAFLTCSRLGKLTVGINSDKWLNRKKGSFFMPYEERKAVINSLVTVDYVLPEWDDSDNTACDAISIFHKRNKDRNEVLIFANGGDRIPSGVNEKEFELCNSLGILSLFGVGGSKTASSSNFLQEYIDKLK